MLLIYRNEDPTAANYILLFFVFIYIYFYFILYVSGAEIKNDVCRGVDRANTRHQSHADAYLITIKRKNEINKNEKM